MHEPADRSAQLARRLLDGVEALRSDRPADAVEALEEVATDPELAGTHDLRDIRARACTLLAQALIDAGRPGEAGPWLDTTARLLEALGDQEGLDALTELRQQRTDRLADQARRGAAASRLAALADTPLEALRERHAGQPVALQEALVQKANAELEAGRADVATQVAEEAIRLAQACWSVRGEVMARMSLARACPARAQDELTAAWRIAERANEFNLVGAVARAAAAAAVPLPETVLPTAGAPLRHGEEPEL